MKLAAPAAAATLLVAITAGGVLLLRRSGSESEDSERPSLRLGVQSSTICALPFIASEVGCFEDAGIDVDIIQYPSGKLALNGMLAGEVDVAACADMPIMTHSFERDDFATFGTIAWTEQGAWIIARRDSGISGPSDLRGKRVATQQNSAVHFFLSMFLLKHGIDEDELELSFMPAVELPAALAEGRIDAFSMRNPFIAEAREALGDNALEMFGPHLYRQTFNLVTWRRTLESNTSSLERMIEGLAAAERLLMADERAAVNAVVNQLGPDREKQVRDTWSTFSFGLSLDQSMFTTLEDLARWAMSKRPELGADIPNYFLYVDPQPLSAVRPDAVNIIR